MNLRSRLASCALGVTVALAIAATTAGSNRIQIDDVDFDMEFPAFQLETPTGAVTCPVTMRGALHANVFSKVHKMLIGQITHAQVDDAECVNPEEVGATVLTADLPWHVVYEEFQGTLPDIQYVNVLIIGASFRADMPATTVMCLFKTTFSDFGGLVLGVDQDHNRLDLVSLVEHPIPVDDVSGGSLCDLLGATTAWSGLGIYEDGGGFHPAIELV